MKARIGKGEAHEALVVETDIPGCAHCMNGQISLVRGGSQAYLWIGARAGHGVGTVYTVSGDRVLRRLAQAILAEIEPKKKRRARRVTG